MWHGDMLHGGLLAKACCCFIRYVSSAPCHARKPAGMRSLALQKTALLATVIGQQAASLLQLLQESPTGDGIGSSGHCYLSSNRL